MTTALTTFEHKLRNNWPFFAGLFSLAMLGIAHAFEKFGGLYPCALCLHQRRVYWMVLGIALVALVLKNYFPKFNLTRAFNAILAVAFFTGAFIAGFHAGVEQHWWPGLAECASDGKVASTADILGALTNAVKVPACDAIAWSWLGLSMAAWNMILSAFLAVYSAYCAFVGFTNSTPLSQDGQS
jgi:disulfide bond formation protein DsbB